MRVLQVGLCGGVAALLACAPGAAPGDTTGEASTETSESAGSSESGELDPLVVQEPEFVLHPGQPMVVDLLVELEAPGTAELHHQSDDDVSVAQLAPAAGEAATSLHFRIRGLLPETTHTLELSASELDGPRTHMWSGSVETNPPQPGFIPKFEIDSLGADFVEPIWRLFDLTQLFSTAPSGVFLVDDEGSTRWYLGDVDDYTDLDDIYTSVALRPDGSVSFMRRDTAWIVDELGEVQMAVTGESFGASAGLHHELIELPNGNWMTLGYSFRDIAYPDEGTLHVAGDMILEFTSAGELVWQWDSFDHFDPQRRRDGFFIPQQIPDPDSEEDGHDWTHANALVYSAEDGLILLSTRHQDWITAIDHDTGAVLWNLGDEGDFELVGDTYWFFHQHSPQWQPDGSLLLYDNAVGNPERPDSESHARAIRYELDLETMQATKIWADDDPAFVSAVAGDADRTPGGHILRLDSFWADPDITGVRARIRELDPEASPNAVWTLYTAPDKFSYRAVPVSRFVGVPE